MGREVREEEEEDGVGGGGGGGGEVFYLFLIVWLFLGRRCRRFGLLRGRVGGRSGLPLWSLLCCFEGFVKVCFVLFSSESFFLESGYTKGELFTM